MSARVTLLARVEQYLAERRRVGFTLRTMAYGWRASPSTSRMLATRGR